MKRLKLARSQESKTRFKMYKSGKQWLFSGLTMIGGLVGSQLVGNTSVSADTTSDTSGTTKENTSDTLVTKTTATIPADKSIANSNANTAASASPASTTTAASTSSVATAIDSHSLSTSASVSQSMSVVSESTSLSAFTSTSASLKDSTSVSDSASVKQSQSHDSSKSSTTDQVKQSTTGSTQNSTLGTSTVVAPVTAPVANQTTAAVNQEVAQLQTKLQDGKTVAFDQKANELVISMPRTAVVPILTTAEKTAASNAAQKIGAVVRVDSSNSTDEHSNIPSQYKSVSKENNSEGVVKYLTANNLINSVSINNADFKNTLKNSHTALLATAPQYDKPSKAPIWFLFMYWRSGFIQQPQSLNTVVNKSYSLFGETTPSFYSTSYQWYVRNPVTGQWSTVNGGTSSTLTTTQSTAGKYYYQLQAQINRPFRSTLWLWSQVVAVNVEQQQVNATGIIASLDNNYLWSGTGQTTYAHVTTTPSNATSKVTWTTSNPSIATVDQYGQVTAGNNNGQVQVIATVTNPDGTSHSSSVNLTIGRGLENQTVTERNSAQFNVQGVNVPSGASVKYEWHKKSAIGGRDTVVATGPSSLYTTPATTMQNNGDKYYVNVNVTYNGTTKQLTSNTATLTVIPSASDSASISASTSTSTSTASASNSASTSTSTSTASDSASISASTSTSASTASDSASISASTSTSASTASDSASISASTSTSASTASDSA
ncbi:Ig-like domain-containing protein, partial [Leuconostoc palmae]|uniref:Ig-like domain-containing protein n=1 Tax=Leuconostoc palmae TaxID=501487 RepID=UPI001C7CD748